MITCSSIGYNGRLANQMFQFASTVGIARKLGYEAKFPEENFIPGNPHDYNGGKLRECFDIPDYYFLKRSEIEKNILYEYNEPHFNYVSDTEIIPDGVNLMGYFQTERYFSHCEQEIRKIFKFRKDLDSTGGQITIEPDSTCLHIRRGDYLSSPNHHPVQDAEYYKRGVEIAKSEYYYVFSDDIQWCKDNIRGFADNVIFIDEDNPYLSLNLMTKCKNHIIANSSLSWWAAWLGKKEDQKVVSPSRWFGDSLSKNETRDLYCKNWIVI